MYLLHHKKNDIYANNSLLLSYSEVPEATRSGPYPTQMIAAVTRSSPYPDQMVDQHLETTSTALNVSEDQGTKMSPRDRSQCGPCHLDSHREKTTGTRWALKIWLCCSWNKLLVRLARGELPPPRLSLVSPKVFFSVMSPMEFWFLAVVASGLLSWGHFISSDITDLIAHILFKLYWSGQWHHWIQ